MIFIYLSPPPFPPHYADVSSPPLFSSHYAVTCTGRIVRSYFEGHGNFLGMVVSKIPERPVVWVVYTDGGGEELYLYVPKKPLPSFLFRLLSSNGESCQRLQSLNYPPTPSFLSFLSFF